MKICREDRDMIKRSRDRDKKLCPSICALKYFCLDASQGSKAFLLMYSCL
ncbi:hypothetical protein Syun_022199 [Stephania yunnanensis]|uniref:Uncharacterized protein n=1 Tax=Stephania yunnanensis TaxID=152371 RepID=A0AAP0NPV7_9MAGN